MPPFYPGPYDDQLSNQYNYGMPYDGQFNGYQYTNSPQQQPQPTPPFSQLQVNIPPHQQEVATPQSQQQYAYQQNLTPNYVQPAAQFQYQQYQHQPQYLHHFQPQAPSQPQIQQQQYFQPMPQYIPPPLPPQPLPATPAPPPPPQVNIPKPQLSPPQRVLKDVRQTAVRQPQPPIPKLQSPKPETDGPDPDYDILLLSLADEYLEAAHKLPFRSEEYFKLTATALGCIDVVLNNFKLQPLREAQVSLRYAQILSNETENYDEAERVLTKTIDICERLKYHDLRYGAQLLLLRVLYQSKPRAALKDLQSMIQDIEAYKHTAWEYAFRMQYVLFAASSNQPSDSHIAINQLERICHVARQNGDHTVLAFAAVLEALAHLQSTARDSVPSSQRSLAKARALQLNPDIEDNPQLCLMMEFIDLCAQIKSCDIAQSEQKRKTMQSILYPALKKPSWRSDGMMFLPLSPGSLRGLQTQDGGLVVERNGRHYLAISWLTKDEVEDLGYLLSGISAVHKNAGDGGKAEKFLDEGLGMIRELLEEPRSVNCAGHDMRIRQQLVECHFLLEMAFMQCSKGQWSKASTAIKFVEGIAQKLEHQFTTDMRCLTDYAKGAIFQGKGDLDAALTIFQSQPLNIITRLENQGNSRPSSQLHRRDDTIRNISILAAINTVFIISPPQHSQHGRLSALLAALEPLANHHPNKSIQAAWNFVLASLPNNTILKTKQYLGVALNTAQGINNAQITTLCLVTMQEKFFKGVVGEQAVKCARAASHQARRLNEPMWIATATGLESECLAVHGMLDEVPKKREEVDRALMMLPEKVKQATL